VDGSAVGACPRAGLQVSVGLHSVRAGEALGNDRYLAYQLEGVEVQKDSTHNIIADLIPATSEQAAGLAYALGAKQIEIDRLQLPDDSKVGALSPDGQILAIGAETNSIRLYDANDGKSLRRLGEPGAYWVSFVTALCFSAEGDLLASSGWLYDKYIGEINIWEVKSGKHLRTIPNVPHVSSMAFSPDGKLLAAGLRPNTIKMWNVTNGGAFWPIKVPVKNEFEVSPLLFSQDGKRIIVGQPGGQNIYVYETLTGQLKHTWPGNLVTLDRDGRVFTFSYRGYDNTLRNTRRLATGELIESKLLKNTPVVQALNEQIVIAASGRESVWDARNEPLIRALNNPGHMVLTQNDRRVLFYHELGLISSFPVLPDAADDPATNEIRTVEFCELIKNPRPYFDKQVRIIARYEMATEGQYLRDDKCPLSHDRQIGVGHRAILDEKQSELLNTELRRISKHEYGGRAMVTMVGILRNASRRDFVWYQYRFDIVKVESISPVIVPYERELQAGVTYRGIVRGDRVLDLSLIPPPRISEHHAQRIEWINLSEFPELEKLQPVSGGQQISFTVLSDEIKQMTELRWNRTIKCKIIRLE
jgi:hypothetical protein